MYYPTMEIVMDAVMSSRVVNVFFHDVSKFGPERGCTRNVWKNVQVWTLPNGIKYLGFGGEYLMSVNADERMPYMVAISGNRVTFKCSPRWQTQSTAQFLNKVYAYFFGDILIHYTKDKPGSVIWLKPGTDEKMMDEFFEYSFTIPSGE